MKRRSDWRLPALLSTTLLLACSGAEQRATPPEPPPPQPTSTAVIPASAAPSAAPAAGEADSPKGFSTRELTGLPAPDARAAKEDLPPGAACRVGSQRLTAVRDYGPLVFASADRLLLEGLGHWTVTDATTGSKLEDFELGWVTSGLSPSGTCAAVKSGEGLVEYYKLPSRELAAKRTYSKDKTDDIVPADDCVRAMRREGYSSACVELFTSELWPVQEMCAGIELGSSALSGDGTRAALAPSRMDARTYEGDGVHVFDTSTAEEIAVVKKAHGPVGKVALSRDGEVLAFTDGEETRMVRLPSREAISAFALGKDAYVRGLTLSPAAKRLAVVFEKRGGDYEGGLAMVDVATGRALFVQRSLPMLGAVAFSPDGSRFAYSVKDGVRIVDTFTGEDAVAPGRFFQIHGQAISPRGDRAVVSSPGHLTVWDTRDCSRVAEIPNDLALDDLLVTPGGTTAVGFHRESMVRVDLATGARATLDLGPLNARDSQVVTPDGKKVVLGIEASGRKQQVVVLDLGAMKELRRITLPKVGPIGALMFAPGGKSLYAAAPGGLANGDSPTGDSSVILVDIENGGLGRRFQVPGASQSYLGAAMEKGRVVVVNDDWREAATGKQLPFPTPRRTLMAVSDDQRTAAWSDEKGFFLWPIDEALPASPPVIPFSAGWMRVGEQAALNCSRQSCLVARAKGP